MTNQSADGNLDNTLASLVKHSTSLQSTVEELITRFKILKTFEEASTWRSDALAVIKLFEQYKVSLINFITIQEENLNTLRETRKGLPFMKRMLTPKSDEKEKEDEIKSAKGGNSSIDEAVDILYELVDDTPSSKAEQTQILKELRQIKNELTIEKRSINEKMRTIRVKARQDTAAWTGISGGAFGSIARSNRMITRNQKEAELRPQEDAKAAIERQLIEVERKINRVSNFTGNDPEPENIEQVLRCAYCGRRVEDGLVCPGCGSDITIVESS